MILYFKPTCPYSRRVLAAAERLGVSFDLRDISADEAFKQELIERGGKKQVPYLVDEERGVEMYESKDIIAHLEKHHGSGEHTARFANLRIHRSDDACSVE